MTTYTMYSATSLNFVFKDAQGYPYTQYLDANGVPNREDAGDYDIGSTGNTVKTTAPYNVLSFSSDKQFAITESDSAPFDTSQPDKKEILLTKPFTYNGQTYSELSSPYGLFFIDSAGKQQALIAIALPQDPNSTFVQVIGFMTTSPLVPGTTYTMRYDAASPMQEYYAQEVGPVPIPDGVVTDSNGNAGSVMDVGYTDAQYDVIGNTTNDVIQGLGGNDTINAGGGNDTVYAGSGSDKVDGGTGNDLLYGYGDTIGGPDDGAADTLIGGLGNDTLIGGGGNDVLYGDDTLGTDSLGGNDSIDAGTGDDTINAGFGNDTVLGGDGADSILAGAGDDSVEGGAGNDTISGGGGHDILNGGDGADNIDGGSGNDSLSGGAGTDRMDGGVGSDTLNGGDGTDTLLGGDGDDDIIVGAGDSASGGNGDDDFILDPTQAGGGLWIINGGEGNEGTPEDTTNNADDGGMAGDKIDGSALTGGVNVTYSTAENGTMTGASSGTFVDIEKVVTGSGNDTINASGATVVGGTGINIDTGAGTDEITGSAGSDTINAGAGDDLVNVSGGADSVAGGTGADTLSGASQTADTTVVIGAGNAGSFSNADGTTTFSGFESFATGSGNDSIDASNATTGITAETGAGNDTITGSGQSDALNGGDGNDSLSGGAGNDSLLGGAGSDTLNGGDGIDLLNAGDGDDDISVGAGDNAYGGEGDDEFFIDPTQSGNGSWVISGGNHGTPAPDDANGSEGDILDTTAVTGDLDIKFGTDGSSGINWGTVSGGTSGDFNTIEIIRTGIGNDTINTDYYVGPALTISSGAGDDNITATNGAHKVFAGDGNDTITAAGGYGGTVDGGAGNDYIDAGTHSTGFDYLQISGGTGNDTIIASTRNDVVGGDDSDRIILDPGNTQNGSLNLDMTVAGGEGGNDFDVLDTTTRTEDFVVTFSGNEAGGIETAQLSGQVQFSAIERIELGSGNDTVDGSATTTGINVATGAGSDIITGGLGADLLDAGDGDDVINFGSGDTVSGGAGDDLFKIDPAQIDPSTSGVSWSVDGGTHGTGGTDTLNGEAGDILDTTLVSADVNITFTGTGAGGATGGAGNGTFTGLEIINTGAGNDVIDGSADNSTGLVLNSGAGNDVIGGGSGSDTLTGGVGFDTFVASGGNDLVTDFDVSGGNDGNASNNDYINLSGYYNAANLAIWNANHPNQTYATPLAWLRADQADGKLDMLDGSNGLPTLNLTLQNGGVAVAGTDLYTENTSVVCFTAGTLIETARGPVAIEMLAEGDLVLTKDRGMQPLRWIGQRTLSGAALTENLRPILIRKGALGANTPSSDLMVSPQHRVLVRSKIAQKMFGTDEVLVAAKQLCQIEGIDIANPAQVTYVHMLFDRHEVVISNGAETESLYTGAEALKSVGPAARAEIFAIFPELADADGVPVSARPLISGRMGRKLAVRHAQNGKALVG